MGIWIRKDGKSYPVSSFNFPGGELHVSIPNLPRDGDITVIARILTSDTLVQLLLVSEIMEREHVGRRDLVFPYFPYARQDRVTGANDSFSLKVVAKIINSLPYQTVTIIDPHSDVTPALLNHCRIVSQWDVLARFEGLKSYVSEESPIIVSPDAGAAKKCANAARMLGGKLVVASKSRNTETGEITSTELHGSVAGHTCLIVDDICDGGRTFIELGKVLLGKGARSVALYVTHGIFSKGFKVFEGSIDRVYCTDTFTSHYGSLPGETPLFIHPLIAKEYGNEYKPSHRN